jgi:opacity protein-like surface antigen
MLKKIAAGAALAAALAFSLAAPAVLSANSNLAYSSSTAVGNWPDPMQATQDPARAPLAVGNWPDPMLFFFNVDPISYFFNVGNWPDPM